MTEFVDALGDLLVASGVATARYSTSGTSLQVDFRRETGAPYVVLLTQAGGPPGERGQSEQHIVNVLIDGGGVSGTLSGTQAKAREIYDFLHERVMFTVSGHDVLWMRALALPQAIPIALSAEHERFQFSVNFQAFIRKAGDH